MTETSDRPAILVERSSELNNLKSRLERKKEEVAILEKAIKALEDNPNIEIILTALRMNY